MSGTLFGRRVAVEFGLPGEAGLRHEGLRISFDVDHTASREPNKGKVHVYNPAPTTIAAAQAKGAVMRLFVGYGVPRLIFQGNPVKNGIRTVWEGPDRILQVEAADGGAAFVQAITPVSFATGTDFGQVLDHVLEETGWARGSVVVPEGAQLPYGVVLTGRAAEVLDRIAAAVGARWWVEDGAVNIVTRGEAVPTTAPLISARAGSLIGVPSPTDAGIEVTALIDAGMRPGRAFVLESDAYNGQYIAGDVKFKGDSGFDREFHMKITAKQAGA
jgi:hypothetical protein